MSGVDVAVNIHFDGGVNGDDTAPSGNLGAVADLLGTQKNFILEEVHLAQKFFQRLGRGTECRS